MFLVSSWVDAKQNPLWQNKAISQLHHAGLLERPRWHVFLAPIPSDKLREMREGGNRSCGSESEREKSDGYDGRGED